MTMLLTAWLAVNFVIVPLIGMRIYTIRSSQTAEEGKLNAPSSASFSQLGGQP